ncbi:hypothetical protein FA13DRAFT_1816426 [Coprinellus micaceus]|uniref:Integral membrane protein n=1 Tax=Coprinellus micaceus TaxID=71717 RepID=A0A4Y7SZL4_COPMI|nr:hypothetical protein FA13DRAFT_1816426 [Coprinellus micaceus]
MFPYSTSDAVTYRKYYLVCFWVETTIYGVYVLLFLLSLKVLRRKDRRRTTSATFVFAMSLAMFTLITIHNFANVHRMLQAFVTIPSTDLSITAPVVFLRDWSTWDCYIFAVILALLTWMADVLVIYRCYLVYQGSYRIILLPCTLLLACVANTSITLHWFRHTDSIPWNSTMKYIVQLTYPLNVIQAVLTTGLIAHRIYSQHRQSARAGIRNKDVIGTVSLILILRIIVESAAIYTIEQLLLCVLWAIGNKAVVIVQHAMVPTIGAVSSLMTVRMHIARAEAATMASPSWIRHTEDSGDEIHSISDPTPLASEGHRDTLENLRTSPLPAWLVGDDVEEEEEDLDGVSRSGASTPAALDGARKRIGQREL